MGDACFTSSVKVGADGTQRKGTWQA